MALHLFAIVGWLALFVLWLRHHPSARPLALGAALVVGLTLVGFHAIDPAAIPSRWISALHEGGSGRNILQLYARTTHAGPNFRAVVSVFSADSSPSIRDIVRMNLWLASLNVVLLAFVLRQATGRRLSAALLAVAWVANPNSINAMFSELPSELLTTYFLLSVLPVAVFESLGSPRRGPWAALCIANVACWGALAGLTRIEWLVIGLPTLGTMVLRAAVPDASIEAWLRTLVQRAIARPLAAALAVWAALSVVEVLPWMGKLVQKSQASWVFGSVESWWPNHSALPSVLVGFLPLVITLLILAGCLVAFRHPLRLGMQPFAICVLWGIYQSASHGVSYERFRYISMLTAPIFVMAAFGWRDLAAYLESRPSAQRRVAWGLAAVTLLSVVPGVPGRFAFVLRPQVSREPEPGIILARNQQRSLRYVLDATERYPRCVFVARISGESTGDGQPSLDHWIFFGQPVARPLVVPSQGLSLGLAVDRFVPDGACVIYYRSRDCNLVRARGVCDPDHRDLPPIDRQQFPSQPYSDPGEYGRLSPVMRIGLFRVDSGADQRG